MNPFVLKPYISPELFCDRVEESKRIIGAIKNGRPITLISHRRYGKTGLISHVHHQLPKKYLKINIDVFDTNSDEDFAAKLITYSVAALSKKKKSILQKAVSVFAQFKATLIVDPILGVPTIKVQFSNAPEAKLSLHTLFQLLHETKYQIQLAIDEFQQIAEYETTHIDATLREAMQTNPNLHIIFSGSKKHILLYLFTDARKPLFSSTEIMHLGKIPYPAYMDFIKDQFKKHDKEIDENQIHHILEWTKMHTYYTQFFCNVLFQKVDQTTKEYDITDVKKEIFQSNKDTYLIYRNLLTAPQWGLLRAIAKEDVMRTPTGEAMRSNYNLGAGSTVSRSLESLLDKEMIYANTLESETNYEVYDVFLSRWMQEILP